MQCVRSWRPCTRRKGTGSGPPTAFLPVVPGRWPKLLGARSLFGAILECDTVPSSSAHCSALSQRKGSVRKAIPEPSFLGWGV